MSPIGVLIVADDNARRLLRTRLELEEHFHIIIEAGAGEQVLVLATKHQPDALILDNQLPDVSGPIVCALRQRLPDAAILIFSGDDPPTARRILRHGADVVIPKYHVEQAITALKAEFD